MILGKFNDEDVVFGKTSRVTSGLWSGGAYEIEQDDFQTLDSQLVLTGSNSTEILNGAYYIDVYDASPAASGQVYFTIAYGHYSGSGSCGQFNDTLQAYPTKVVYKQLKNALLSPSDVLFSFTTGSTTVDSVEIVALNFSNDKIKDRLDEGQFQIFLSGSNGLFKFIDDSVYLKKNSDVFSIVSGSIGSDGTVTYTGTSGAVPIYDSIGLFYPKAGIVIFNATKIASLVGIPTNTAVVAGSAYPNNSQIFLNAITAAGTNKLKARKSEYIPSRHYFVRAKNRDFNYSNNPSYVNDGTDGTIRGTIKHQELVSDPKTYITTIGLFNENNELVAVAKLSSPYVKGFDNEMLCKIKLDF